MEPVLNDALLNNGGAWRSAWALQQLSATELDSRIALLEDAARACRAERESRKTRPDALSKLNGDVQGLIFVQLCNVLDPGIAVALSSVNNELWTATQAPRQQLKTDHEAAAALCRKVPAWHLRGRRNCKDLREAAVVDFRDLTLDELKLLGTLGSVLPALQELRLHDDSGSAGPEGVQGLAEGLIAGSLPAVTYFGLFDRMHVGDAGFSALAAALGRGAMPRLESLSLGDTAIGDAGLVALAPALRRLPALKWLHLGNIIGSPLGDEGLAALVAPPPPAGTPPLPAGGLKKLKTLVLFVTQVSDAGCASLVAALNSGALPALKNLDLRYIPASDAAKDALRAALALRGIRGRFTAATSF